MYDSASGSELEASAARASGAVQSEWDGFIFDTLPEWSKGVDSSSTSASCVGSNPTGVMSHV